MHRPARLALLAACLAVIALPLHAQQSVQPALDDCLRAEQRDSRVLGSVLGVLGGLSLGGRRDNGEARPASGVRITLGGAAGGVLGQASAYFNAVGACFKKNPDWVPASRLERGEGYQAAMAESGYAREDGIVVLAVGIEMPGSARPEASIEIRSRFLLLTPDGAEAPVHIERKLFAIAEGQEAALPLPAHGTEARTLAAGEHWDRISLPIPRDAPLGVSYRVEFSVSVGERPASSVKSTVKVI